MRFAELLASAKVTALQSRGDAEITGVVADSRGCRAGCCFVAVRGCRDDGHRYIGAAAAGGAAAVVCEEASPVPKDTPFAVVEDTRAAVGPLAQAIRGWPADELVCIGVTGTNGKTTVADVAGAVLAEAGFRPAVLGTIRYETGRRVLEAGTTTPDAVALAELAAEMVAAGRTHLVMEVSSHALDQQRVCGLTFQAGVFTNLSGDHLDYHGTMERYKAAKRRLFELLPASSSAVLNRDDPAAEEMAAATSAQILWYGLSPAANVRARIERIDAEGTEFTLMLPDRTAAVTTRLIGRHNVYNALAAAAACASLGVDLPTIASALSKVQRVAGRLERVETGGGYQVFVDYAHTDDALKNVLKALRPLTRRRIILLFGCGGDRDRSKRPRMARVAQELADRIVITSDNPRSENPAAIVEEIVTGLNEAGRARTDLEPDRRKAIALAIDQARDGDVVLLAGKGHERYQTIGMNRIPFDDVEVARECVRARESAP
jgi:UDP-N-acetylmuramoyl-L-alanyl-D-glutamate--2,6-diaminopimelate ligase